MSNPSIESLRYNPTELEYAALYPFLSLIPARTNALLTVYTRDGSAVSKHELTERLEEEVYTQIIARYAELLFQMKGIDFTISKALA